MIKYDPWSNALTYFKLRIYFDQNKVSNSKPQFKPLVQPARGGVQPSQYQGTKYQVNTTYAPKEIVNASNSNQSDFPKITPPSPTNEKSSFPPPPTSSFPPPPTEFLKSSPTKPTVTSPVTSSMTSSTTSSSYTPTQSYTPIQKFTPAPKIEDRPSALAPKSEINAFQQRVQSSQRPTVTSSQPKSQPVSQPIATRPSPERIVAPLPVTAQSKPNSNSTSEFMPPPPPPVVEPPKVTSSMTSSQPLSQPPKPKSQPSISKPVQPSSNSYQNSNYAQNLADEVNNIQLAESRNVF